MQPILYCIRHRITWGVAVLLLSACGGGGDYAPTAAQQAAASREAPANVQGDPIYRFAKISSGAYFYTGSQWEADNIRDTLPDFRYEGIAFYQSDQASGTPVYRFANTANGGYFYTANAWERDNTIANYPNMRYEGSTFSVAPAGDPNAAPVYRLANLNNGAYLYTTNPAERDAAVALGFWRDEGTTFSARTSPAGSDNPGPIDESFPAGRVLVVVPFAAGSSTDTIARNLVEALNQQWGNGRAMIMNDGGAGGTRGFAQVATSAPDGYRILLTNGSLAASPTLYRNLNVSLADLAPAGLFYETPMILAGARGLPVSNHAELLTWLQANQGSARMAYISLTSASYLCALQYLAASQVAITKVSYRGSAPAVNDLLMNQVSLLCEVATGMAQLIETGKAKGLGITSPGRQGESLGQIPTFAEMGMPNMQMSDWYGLYVPKGTPTAIVNRINDSLRKAMQNPAYIARQVSMRGMPVTDARLTPAGHKAFLEAEAARWAPLIQAAGQYAD